MQSIHVNGFDMHYVASGHGPPLVLVHGSFTDLRFWQLQTDVFAESFEVFRVSLRPYWPNSQATPIGIFDASQYADDLSELIATLGVGPVHLCGHSLGGHIAFRVAQRRPTLVRTLVLAEPGGPLSPELLPATGTLSSAPVPVIEQAAQMILRGEIDHGLALVVASATRPGAWETYPDFYKTTARDNAKTLVAQAREKRAPITREEIRAMRQPVLLIGGASSPQPFPRILDALQANLANVVRAHIRRGTHLMNIENPNDFNASIMGFLARHASSVGVLA